MKCKVTALCTKDVTPARSFSSVMLISFVINTVSGQGEAVTSSHSKWVIQISSPPVVRVCNNMSIPTGAKVRNLMEKLPSGVFPTTVVPSLTDESNSKL